MPPFMVFCTVKLPNKKERRGEIQEVFCDGKDSCPHLKRLFAKDIILTMLKRGIARNIGMCSYIDICMYIYILILTSICTMNFFI